MERSAQIAHLETVSDLSKADQKRFVAMMQRIVTRVPNGQPTPPSIDRP